MKVRTVGESLRNKKLEELKRVDLRARQQDVQFQEFSWDIVTLIRVGEGLPACRCDCVGVIRDRGARSLLPVLRASVGPRPHSYNRQFKMSAKPVTPIRRSTSGRPGSAGKNETLAIL